MAKVVPALLVKTVDEYRQRLKVVKQLTDRFQIDVIDPEFADNETVDLALFEPRQDIRCDIHIMSPNPSPYIASASALHPGLIIVQYEGVPEVEKLIEDLSVRGIAAGIAINPSTAVTDIVHLLPALQHVLIMAYPAGFAGQDLQPSVLKKVAEVRELAPHVEVGLDGGVSAESLDRIAKAGFDVVNVNSYLFGAEDVLSRYTELMEALA